MNDALVIRRRSRKHSPLHARRIGAVLDAPQGAAPANAVPFPGIPETPSRRRASALASGAFSTLVHAALVGGLLLLAWYAPTLEEEVIPVQLIHEVVIPEKKPDDQAAPAPKALAERRAVDFAPQAQALQPQILNPTVVARAAPVMSAERLQMDQVAAVAAPKQITRAQVSVEHAAAIQSAVPVQASKVDLGAVAAPALRGPVDATLPAGPSVGPRQVVSNGNTVGTGSAIALGDSSSVREGIASTRDVAGSLDGARLANVNTRVGDGFLRGDGGTGSGAFERDCLQRPEVLAYMDELKRRMYARWVVPADVTGNRQIQLRIKLEAGGSLLSVENVKQSDELLGSSAMEALRASSPFPPMSGPTRCLAQRHLLTTWSTLEN
jgi:hypothetical protein